MRSLWMAMLAAMMILAAVFLLTYDFGDQERTYDIEYHLDGGVNGDNPATYTRNDEIVFEPAVREGYEFSGWFSDASCTQEVYGVSKGTKGDLDVYAGWTSALVGTGYVMELSGKYNEGFGSSMSGTYEFRFLATDDEDYFLEMKTDVRYGPSGHSDDTFYWYEDDSRFWTPVGKESLQTVHGKVLCDVLEFGDKTRWVSGFTVYKEICESKHMDYECVLISTFVFEADPDHTVSASESTGISAYIGPGTYATGSEVTVKAVTSEGYKLDGWYSGGELVTRSADYRISGLHSDVSLKAVAVKDSATHWTVGVETDLSDGTGSEDTVWTITEKYGGALIGKLEGKEPMYTFVEPGRYIVHNDTTGKSREVLVDGDVSRTVEWSMKYQGTDDASPVRHSFSIEWTIPYSHYSLYREMDSVRNHTTETVDSRFITWMDDDIAYLSALLEQEAAEMAPEKKGDMTWMANYVLAFVQYVAEYEPDGNSRSNEYWKYPVETLFDGKGDCEDATLLFVAITNHMKMDSMLILYLPSTGNGHAFGGIVVDASGSYYDIDGKKVYYCECTGHGYTVGRLPEGGEAYEASSIIYPYHD